MPSCRRTSASSRGRRGGFTLVELLVVLATIGVLVALLIPAVQKVRDAAARSQCASNLKQIALAIHAYEADNKILPVGLDNHLTCAFVQILPYLEQRAVYDGYDFTNNTWWSDQTGWNIPAESGTPPNGAARWGAEGQIPVFLCPAAPPPMLTTAVAQVRVMGISGVHYPYNSGYAPPPGRTRYITYNFSQPANANAVAKIGRSNFVLSSGYLDTFDDYIGLFTWKRKIKMRQISDGTSNTIAVLESAGGYIDFNAVGQTSGWGSMPWAHAFVASNVGTCPDATNSNCIFTGQGQGLSPGLPGSLHGGRTINTAYADGSVRTIPANIDFALYVYLCGYRDGQNVSPE